MATKEDKFFPVFSQLHSDTPATSVSALPSVAELLGSKPARKPRKKWNKAKLFVVPEAVQP